MLIAKKALQHTMPKIIFKLQYNTEKFLKSFQQLPGIGIDAKQTSRELEVKRVYYVVEFMFLHN